MRLAGHPSGRCTISFPYIRKAASTSQVSIVVHLTSILSKTVERVIGQPLVAFLEARGFGDAQWAFRKKSSARDLVTIYAAKWVLLICRGFRVGLYLSDIFVAFDINLYRQPIIIPILSHDNNHFF